MSLASRLENPMRSSTDRSTDGEVLFFESAMSGSTISSAREKNLALSSSSLICARCCRLILKSSFLFSAISYYPYSLICLIEPHLHQEAEAPASQSHRMP